VPNNSDDEFREYLRQFRPMEAGPFPVGKPSWIVSRRLQFGVLTASAVACLIAILFPFLFSRKESTAPHSVTVQNVGPLVDKNLPLTVGGASRLLVRSPSAKSILDRMAFQPRFVRIPEGRHSALATLSKEKTTL
jgi:hypothetical protein